MIFLPKKEFLFGAFFNIKDILNHQIPICTVRGIGSMVERRIPVPKVRSSILLFLNVFLP